MVLPGRGRRGVAGILTVALIGSGFALLTHAAPSIPTPARAVGHRLRIGHSGSPCAHPRRAHRLDGAGKGLGGRHAADHAGARRRLRGANSDRRLDRQARTQGNHRGDCGGDRRCLDEAAGDRSGRSLRLRRSGLEILALAGPPGFPVGQGELLPEARARHLLDRMAAVPGPSAGSTTPNTSSTAHSSPRAASRARPMRRSSKAAG